MEQKKLNVCGLIGIILEVVGIFIFGLPCSIAGLVLGIVGTSKEDQGKALPIISIVGGAIELLIMLIYLGL